MTTQQESAAAKVEMHQDEVEIRGHIIDSLILPKILDTIIGLGGSYRIKHIDVGRAREDASHAVVEVQASSEALLSEIISQISDHGAVSTSAQDCQLLPADMDGAFPEGFYSTTNQRTEVRSGGRWMAVADQEMDCGIVVDLEARHARTVPMNEIKLGDAVVVGHAGVRVFPEDRAVQRHSFGFMGSSVSTEKPKRVALREIARELHRIRASEGRTLVVGGPAIVHTGSGEHLCQLIRSGYVHVLFAGNALAAHDIEQSMFGTSLGVHLDRGISAEAGHEHHLRAINRVRRAGSIRAAVESGLINSGIMYECVRKGVDVLLAGSIRDDGPLPDVITDVLEAQQQMRQKIRGVSFALLIATALHSIAVGNLLPAHVGVACVDINPSTVIKLADRGTSHTVGLVTDVEPFLRSLVLELAALD